MIVTCYYHLSIGTETQVNWILRKPLRDLPDRFDRLSGMDRAKHREGATLLSPIRYAQNDLMATMSSGCELDTISTFN